MRDEKQRFADANFLGGGRGEDSDWPIYLLLDHRCMVKDMQYIMEKAGGQEGITG